jgi:hypothetical protein
VVNTPIQLEVPVLSATVPPTAKEMAVLVVLTKLRMNGEPAKTEQVCGDPGDATRLQFKFGSPGPTEVKTKSMTGIGGAGNVMNMSFEPGEKVRSRILPITPGPRVPPEYATLVPIPVSTHPVPGSVPMGNQVMVVAVTVTPPPPQFAMLRVPTGEANAGLAMPKKSTTVAKASGTSNLILILGCPSAPSIKFSSTSRYKPY